MRVHCYSDTPTSVQTAFENSSLFLRLRVTDCIFKVDVSVFFVISWRAYLCLLCRINNYSLTYEGQSDDEGVNA